MKNSCAKEPMATCTNCSECMWIVCGFGRRGAHPNLGIAPHYPCLHVEVEAIAEVDKQVDDVPNRNRQQMVNQGSKTTCKSIAGSKSLRTRRTATRPLRKWTQRQAPADSEWTAHSLHGCFTLAGAIFHVVAPGVVDDSEEDLLEWQAHDNRAQPALHDGFGRA